MHVFIYVPSICFESFSYCVYQGSFFSNHCQHFFVCSVQLIFSIILYDCTSKASGLSFVSSFSRITIHVSDPYSTNAPLYSTYCFYQPLLQILVWFSLTSKSYSLLFEKLRMPLSCRCPSFNFSGIWHQYVVIIQPM